MRVIAAIAAAAVTILVWAGAGWAQDARTTLPDVNVTAPVPPPPPRFSPMAGKTRVEEDKWPEIPCDKSRINSAAAGKCQDGPRVESFMSVMSTGAQPAVGSTCNIAHHLLNVDVGRFAVEADALVFDPYLVAASGTFNKFCTVWSGYRDMPEDFKDMNQVARRGVAWRNFVPGGTSSGAQSTIEFSDGQRGCVAVERLGPPWRGGYVWVIHATICGAGAQPIGQADIDSVFGALQIRTYDPSGNLRPPG
jgi:hypothetical protein